MIRLQFIDKFCDTLDDLKTFLEGVAKEGEKNAEYIISVAEKFRKGIIEEWLIQEKSFHGSSGGSEAVTGLDSLIDSAREVQGKLDSDSEIFNWMLRVICNQLDSSVSVNPYRYIDPLECVVRFDSKTGLVTGRFRFQLVQAAKEVLHIYAELDGKRTQLTSITMKGMEGRDYCLTFFAQSAFSVSNDNLLSVRILIEEYELTDAHVLLNTNVIDVYLRAHHGLLYLCRKEDNSFKEKTSAIVGRDHRNLKESEKNYLKGLNGYIQVTSFNPQGVAKAKSINGSFYHLYKDGSILWVYFFQKAWLVGNGMAALKKDDDVIFVNKDGRIIINQSDLVDMSVFSEGYLAVQKKSGEWAYMDKSGRIIGSYNIAGDFKDGYARVYRESFLGTGGGWKIMERDFYERDTVAPSNPVIHAPAPLSLDGMKIVFSDVWGLFSEEDERAIPVTKYLPELEERMLFEFV